jgi:hypothetical protein
MVLLGHRQHGYHMNLLSFSEENQLEAMECLQIRFSVMSVPCSNFSKTAGKMNARPSGSYARASVGV